MPLSDHHAMKAYRGSEGKLHAFFMLNKEVMRT